MKKIMQIILVFLMFIPIVVNAANCDPEKITIEELTMKNKSEGVTEVEEATAEGRNIKLDVTMSEVGNVIEYQLLIKNDSDEDYDIDKTSININANYIDYSLETDDGTKIVKANTSRLVTLKVEYKTEVPEESFTNGVYSEQKHMVLKLQTDSEEEIENPDTGGQMLTSISILIGLLLISGIIYMTLRKKKYGKALWLIGGLLITIPVCINALCKCEINIDYKVTITTKKLSTFKISCADNDEYHYYEGMTFGEWIKSDLYPGNIGGEFVSVQQCKEIWGENKGCSEETYENVYSYLESITEIYTDSIEACEEGENCVEVNNQYYLYEYTYNLYDTLEQCEANYGEGECKSKNNKYGYFEKEIYQTEEECNIHLSNNPDYYPSCTLLPKSYKYDNTSYSDFYTLEECENYHQMIIENYEDDDTWVDSRNCISRRKKHKNSPQYKQGTMKGQFDFWEEGAMYVNDELLYFEYNKVLSNQTYECVTGGECVSPESEILSSNGRTIKAKELQENDDIAYYNFETNKVEIGKVKKTYIHKDATSFVKYILEDGTYIDVTDYHPIYTSTGWKSYTNRKGYATPKIGDLVKTNDGYKKLTKIEPSTGKEDYYDFQVMTADGNIVNNYFANGVLVEGSY